jgi:RimJ/RimL family protein N-acetyltransferase
LGFRNWSKTDLVSFAEINKDTAVMEYFPYCLTKNETVLFIERLKTHYSNRGYNYFATEILATGEFIGFIGLADQDYNSVCTPATDIGWRLKKSSWGKGFATEGAKKCLEYAFKELKLEKIIATCAISNTQSENVMKKIGMSKMGTFNHPKLKQFPTYEQCLWYEIKTPF